MHEKDFLINLISILLATIVKCTKNLLVKSYNVVDNDAYCVFQLMLNVDNMSGNTFLNFFLLSVIEGPAYFLGVWLSVGIQILFISEHILAEQISYFY